MADTKLSALTELAAAPATGDEVYIRDISEAASAESKRITIANLLQNIPFPATQSASGDANTLDDYEEGTWTPGISDSSVDPEGNDKGQGYSTQAGFYTKIGNRVICVFRVTISDLGTMNDELMNLVGLPFPASSTADSGSSLTVGRATSLGITASESITGIVTPNTVAIPLVVWNGAAGIGDLIRTELTVGANLQGSFTYGV